MPMLKPIRIFAIFVVIVLLAAALQPAIANSIQNVIATPETISVSEEYGAIMAAVNAARTGDVDPSLDTDGDGISDYDEINGFTWMNKTYFTNPYQASTDRDPYDDYMEITGVNMPTVVKAPGRHPCVPSSPNFEIELEDIDYETICEITSSEAMANGTKTTVGGSKSTKVSLELGAEKEVSKTPSTKYHAKFNCEQT
jgi:hypothetical protein